MKDKPALPVPARSRDGKVAKRSALPSSRRDSRQSSISSAAQEQLEHFAKEASSSVLKQEVARLAQNQEPDGTGLGLGLGLGMSMSMSMSTSVGNLAESDSAGHHHHSNPDPDRSSALSSSAATEEFQADHQMRDHSTSMDSELPSRTAAELAHEAYGDALRIDNAVCKKLASVTARREATQRRADQKLNMERRSNVEALLAQMTGGLSPRPCKNCFKGHGPWTQCVVFSGQMCGSCANCWFNASGSRCTFHENNHPHLSRRYMPPGTTTTPPPPSKSIAATHKPTSSQLTSIASFQAAHVDRWNVSEGTKRLIQQTMGDVATYSRRDRYLARIEAAAEELGMRIAEYEDYLGTPEGMAEQRAALEHAQTAEESQSLALDSDHGPAGDESMRDASQETVRS